MFPLAEWMPDSPELSQGGREAKNCLWLNGRYQQLRDKTTSTSAFSGTCKGAYAFLRVDNNTRVLAGTESTIQELDGAAWTSRGTGYSLTNTARWEFCQFGDYILAATISEDILSLSSGGGTFAAISGAPKAACIWALRNFVMCGDIGGVSPVPHKVQWCAIGDSQDWPSPGSTDAQTKQAGEQALRAQAGRIMAIRGSEYALIFQEEAITRATYVGGAIVWQFDPIDEKRGAVSPLGVVQVGREVYYLARDGFYVTDGASTSRPIGYGKVDEWFREKVDKENLHRIAGAHDPERKIIVWVFPSTSSADGTPDSEIIYNYAEGKWTHSDIGMEMVFSAASSGVTLDGLDAFSSSIDALSASLDSAQWFGGGSYLGAISSGALYSFEGDPLTAIIDTGEFQAAKGRRSLITKVRPECDGATTVQIGYRGARGGQDYGLITGQDGSLLIGQDGSLLMAQGEAGGDVTWSPESVVGDDGYAPFRINTFYARIRLTISDGFSEALGVHLVAKPIGAR